MRQNRPIPFKISSLDGLGQGVSKSGERITFIPKTLPGEEGEAIVLAEKKGVAFAKATSWSVRSPERVESVCPHFATCPSCHFLHTPYERELLAKEDAFRRLFRNLPLRNLKIVPAPRRLGYRNRIQLHYDTKKQKLGMLDARSSEIIPVPSCLIGEEKVLAKLKELYANDLWLRIAPKDQARGHVEIYLKNDSVVVNWNQDYALGGFTQVFEEMNQKLKSELQNGFAEKDMKVLDLFAGNGNLTDKLPHSKRLCVDIYTQSKSSEFLSQSLYEKNALSNVTRALEKNGFIPDTLILDPPRSGLTNLNEWLDKFTPLKVAYVSCDPNTLARDLQKVTGYEITGAVLLDFFPSTFHYESLIFLERK